MMGHMERDVKVVVGCRQCKPDYDQIRLSFLLKCVYSLELMLNTPGFVMLLYTEYTKDIISLNQLHQPTNTFPPP